MIVKFISNIDATLYIDQEQVALLYAGKIYKYQLEIGSYLLEVVPVDNTVDAYVEDYELIEEKQTLKRLDFIVKDQENRLSKSKEVSLRQENTEIYPSLCDYNDRGIAVGTRYGIERFVTRDGKIWIVNDIKKVSVANASKFVLDSDRYDWCGHLQISQKTNGCSYLTVVKNDKWGVCIVEEYNSPKLLVPCIYDKVVSVYADWDLIIFQKDSYRVLVNLNGEKYNKEHELSGQYLVAPIGEELCQVICDELYPVVRVEKHEWFSLGSMSEKKVEIFFPHSVVAYKNGKYGLCHLRSANPNFVYDDLFSKCEDGKLTKIFHENIPIIARRGNFLGLVNANGLELTSFIYDDIYLVGEIIVAKKHDKYSLLDKSGMQLTPMVFDNIRYENESYIVATDKKCGIYSFSDNALLLPCVYDSISQIEYKVRHTFTHDTIYAYLCVKEGKKGVFDKEGKSVIECNFEDIRALENSFRGIPEYDGYLLKQNGRYGWWTHSKGIVSECLYDAVETICDEEGYGYIIVKKNQKWGCYSFNGQIIFDIEYDSIRYNGCSLVGNDWLMMFLCSKDRKTYVNDAQGINYQVLDYEEVIPCVSSSTLCKGYFYVKKNGLLGLNKGVNYPIEYVKCEYGSLNVMTVGNKYIYASGKKKGKMYLIICSVNGGEPDRVHEVDCDKIYPALDSTHKEYSLSSNHQDRYAFVFVKDEKQGIIELNGEIVVPAIYDEIVQVEKDERDKVAFFMTRQNDKIAAFDIKRRCIVPAAYQDIVFKKKYFVVSKDGCVGIYSLDGSSILPCIFSQYPKLTSHQFNVYSELKKNPKSDNWGNDIPITIWGAEYNTYVAFNSESGAIIVSNPMPFEEIMAVLKNYKENYQRKLQ